MHTLIAYWHRLPPSEPATFFPTPDITLKGAMEQLLLWGMPVAGLTTEQIMQTYLAKKRQLNEMDLQFRDGEKVADGVGLARVGRSLEDRVGSWPAWLFEILSRKLNYDAVNKQFFYKHPDEAQISKINRWMFRIKVAPMRHFAGRFPLTTLRNILHLKALRETLLADTKHFNVSAIDQPEKGEDGYYHFRDNSFWEEGEA